MIDISPTVKAVAYVVGAILVALLAGWMGWKLFFADHAAQAAHDKAEIHAVQVVGQAKGEAGANAVSVVAGTATKETIIHETTRDHYVEITKQPGADDPVSDPLFDAFTRSICMRVSAARLPQCQPVPGADPR